MVPRIYQMLPRPVRASVPAAADLWSGPSGPPRKDGEPVQTARKRPRWSRVRTTGSTGRIGRGGQPRAAARGSNAEVGDGGPFMHRQISPRHVSQCVVPRNKNSRFLFSHDLFSFLALLERRRQQGRQSTNHPRTTPAPPSTGRGPRTPASSLFFVSARARPKAAAAVAVAVSDLGCARGGSEKRAKTGYRDKGCRGGTGSRAVSGGVAAHPSVLLSCPASPGLIAIDSARCMGGCDGAPARVARWMSVG